MRIERFDAASDPGLAKACYGLYMAGASADDPAAPPMSDRAFAGWLALGWTEDHPETWLARDEQGHALGWYSLAAPERDNRHLAYLQPLVDPSRRRAGLGTILVRDAARRARELGRTMLAGDARNGSPGAEFARALGAEPGITEIIRALDVSAIPAGHVAGLREGAQASATGYTLLTWEGPAPGGRLAEVAALNAAIADAPRDAGTDTQHWDAQRVRECNLLIAAQGLRHYTVAARCERTGDLAGLTQLGVDPASPGWAFQELTVVARAHRGHRLGLLLKATMLEWLADREPQLKTILTGNADANAHMIAINAELGFRILDRRTGWQLGVTEALALPGDAGQSSG